MSCISCEMYKKELLDLEIESMRIKNVLSLVTIELNRDGFSKDKANELLDSIYPQPVRVENDKIDRKVLV